MVRGVSPLIVRTVVVPADATLQLLHEALLVCLDWSGEHLHAFTIRAVDYSADWMIGGVDTRNVTLDSLGLRVGERFTWSYDFTAGWVIDLRVESVAGEDPTGVRCVSGRRVGPPERCGGPGGFRAWEDSHSVLEFVECVTEIRDRFDAHGVAVDRQDVVERLRTLARWMVRDRFDKAGVNRRLHELEVRSCVSSSRSG
jgi:hypothetical protein